VIWEEFFEVERHPLGGPPGVYVIYDHRGAPKYVGSSDRVWDRLGGKHLAGSDTHAVQRAYKLALPDRIKRRAFLKRYVKISYIETETVDEAKEIESRLISKYEPAWNLSGIRGRKEQDTYEEYDYDFMAEYV